MKTLRLAPAFLLAALQIAALVTGPVKISGQQRGRSFEQFAQFEMKLDGWRTQNYDRQSHNYEILQPAHEGWPLLVDNCASLPKKTVELENPKTRPDGKPLPPLITRNVSY
jgi:hypothetical protein